MSQRGNSFLHNPGVSLPLIISGHGFCGHPWLSRSEGGPFSLGRTDTSTRILGAIYTVPKPIRHNPGVSLPLIISGHGFCGHPWLSRSEGGPFFSAAWEGIIIIIIVLVALILSGGAVAMFHWV